MSKHQAGRLRPTDQQPTTRIVEILDVTDTRAYEEEGDRWVPIPGSGIENECARCHRMHEVHATVKLSDGSVIKVGTGCMNAEDAEVVSRLKSAASRAKRIASLRAEIGKLERLAADAVAIRRAVHAMPLPPIVATTSARSVGKDSGVEHAVFLMGETKVWTFDPPGTPISRERRDTLTWGWQNDQARALGETYAHIHSQDSLKDARKRLAKLEATAAAAK